MIKELISTEEIKTIALVGISKNSGKTTVLNSLIASFPMYRWAVLSTGIDGEESDAVFRTPKPRVQLLKGTLFCSDKPALAVLGSSVSILKKADFGPRELFVAQAEVPLLARITGPGSVKDQYRMVRLMQSLGAEKVLIDGALDRKSIALQKDVDAIILCLGASFGPVELVKEELKRLLVLRDIPPYPFSNAVQKRLLDSELIMYQKKGQWQKSPLKSLLGDNGGLKEVLEQSLDALYLPTSLTDSVFEKIGSKLKTLPKGLILRHPECLKMKLKNTEKLVKSLPVYTLIPFKLAAFALNSTAIGSHQVSAKHFRDELRQAFPQLDFFDTMEP